MKQKKANLPVAAKAIEDFLDALGLDRASDPELMQTGKLVAEAFHNDLISGYAQSPSEILSDQMATTSEGLVLLKHIQITTMCPHHLLPAFGEAHVAYLPSQRNVGFGAIGKLVHCFANRLTLQEKLGESVVNALEKHLQVEGAGCVIVLRHGCMTCRGGRYTESEVVTRAYAGKFQESESLQKEFLSHIYKENRTKN